MSLIRNKSGTYEADIGRGAARLHVSLRTTRKSEAEDRHDALKALLREGQPELVAQLKARTLTIEAIARCWRERKPFESLRTDQGWPTLGEAARDYLGWLASHPNRAAQTHAAAVSVLKDAVKHFGEDTRLDAVTQAGIIRYRAYLTGRGLSIGTVGNYLTRLAGLYSWVQGNEARAAREGKRGARTLYTPIARDIVPAAGKGRVRFLSPEEAVRLMQATPMELKFPVAAGILAGLRLEEMLHLRPPPFDLDFEHGFLSVAPKGDWKPKSRTSVRHVPMGTELAGMALVHWRRFASAGWMVPDSTGNASMHPDVFRRQFMRCVADAGLVVGARDPLGVSYHTLRHTFASWLVMRGVDLYTVSKLMGHASVREVEGTYAHLSQSHLDRAIAELSAFRLTEMAIIPANTTDIEGSEADAREGSSCGRTTEQETAASPESYIRPGSTLISAGQDDDGVARTRRESEQYQRLPDRGGDA